MHYKPYSSQAAEKHMIRRVLPLSCHSASVPFSSRWTMKKTQIISLFDSLETALKRPEDIFNHLVFNNQATKNTVHQHLLIKFSQRSPLSPGARCEWETLWCRWKSHETWRPSRTWTEASQLPQTLWILETSAGGGLKDNHIRAKEN